MYKLSSEDHKEQQTDEVDLRAVLRGEKSIQRDDRLIVERCAKKQKEMARMKQKNQKKFNKQMILSEQQYFGEESMFKIFHGMHKRFVSKDNYKITAHTRDA